MAAEHAAVEVNDIARQRRVRLELVDDIGIFALRHETDVLAVGLLGNDKAHVFGKRPLVSAFGQIAERETQIIDLLLRRGKQEIALIAISIRRAKQRAAAGAPGCGLALERM